MRRFMFLIVLVALVAPSVLAQTLLFTNIALDDANVPPGSWVLAQKIRQTASITISVIKVKVFNTATGDKLPGTDVERIEVRRSSDSRVLGALTTGFENFTTTGIEIPTTANNQFTAPFDLEIWVKLKPTASLGKKFALGGTKITYNPEVDVDYSGASAATFTTVPVYFVDGPGPETPIYREQRFLAARFEVNNLTVGTSRTVSRVDVRNIGDVIKLEGSYIARIEIIRARDGNRLGERTTGFGNFTSTTAWVEITTSSYNTISAYSLEAYEIWITLRGDTPTGHHLKLAAQVRLTGTSYDVVHPVWGEAPRFVVGSPAGLEKVQNVALDAGRVFSGQRFLAQRIEVGDDDLDPYNVNVESFVIQNVANSGARLAETQIAKIEVRRARDGALLGEITDASGFNAGGVRIPPVGTAIGNNIVVDDTSEMLEIWVTLKTGVPHGRTLRLQTTIWHTEGGFLSGPVIAGNATFETGPEAGEGFETATSATISDRTVAQGARFLAQRLDLRDNDPDPYNVTISSLMIRNHVPDNPLADQHVAKIEVRRKSDDALLGEVADPVGLSLAGVRVATSANNLVPDDTSVELEIWITLKDTAPTGRKLRLETVVWHTEGTATKSTTELVGPATFTTAINRAPVVQDFSWTPANPTWEQEVTFTPGTITDPDGDPIVYSKWDFGEGAQPRIVERDGPPQTASTRFPDGGTFNVTLTVTDDKGLSGSKTKTIQVTPRPNQPPTVDFSWTPANPVAGQEVTFTATVTDPDTPPDTPFIYLWTFHDGTTSTAESPRKTYDAAGTYSVKLEVTDRRGLRGSREKTITIAAPPGPPAPTIGTLTWTPASPEVDQEVTFTATATAPAGDPIVEWSWDAGDGTPVQTVSSSATTFTFRHTYTRFGTFTVHVRARNTQGGWSPWFSRELYIRPKGVLIGTQLLDNPAATQARIQIFLPPGATGGKIQIFDQLGRLVLEKAVTTGTFTWDLKDGNGRRVPDGLYFYLVTATVAGKLERSEIGKILVLR